MSAKKVHDEYLRIHKVFLEKQKKFYAAKAEYATISHELDSYLVTWQPVVSAYRDAATAPRSWLSKLFGAK